MSNPRVVVFVGTVRPFTLLDDFDLLVLRRLGTWSAHTLDAVGNTGVGVAVDHVHSVLRFLWFSQ